MIGSVLGNRYEILEKIGGGGMALVYKAKCRLLNRYVAIKVLRSEFTNDEEFIIKFKRESQSSASLSHPNIVSIYDVGCENEIHYIVMEYVKGKTLKQVIRENEKLSPKKSIDITINIAEALFHAHKNNIVHRDIKPHNIMITDEGRVKVMDFGIARAATSSTVTTTSNVIGSVHYFSPEQARGGYTDEKSDLYSLGIVMYEMVTGTVPFQGDSPISVALKHIREEIIPANEIDSTIPSNVDKIIRKATQKDQTMRYESAQEFLKDLRKAQNFGSEDIIELKSYNDSPTLIIPAVKDDIDLGKNKSKKKKKKKNTAENNSSKAVTIFAIILAFLLTSALAIGFFKVKGYLSAKEVEVPDIIGYEVYEAKDTIEEIGLLFNIKGEKFDSEYKAGHVISQTVDPGSIVKSGYPIEVYISKGADIVIVPNLLNVNYTRADILISEAGLVKGKAVSEYSEYPINYVISQSPEANDEVEKDTVVNYVISKGQKEVFNIIPKLEGLNIEDAKKLIIQSGFIVGNIEPLSSESTLKDVVTWQSYPYGENIKEGTIIDLKVSTGPSSNDNGDSTETNGNTNNEENSKAIQIKLSQDKEEVEIKIKRIQNNVEDIIYNKIHKTSEGSVFVPISGKGVTKFIIFIDGNLTKEIVETFK